MIDSEVLREKLNNPELISWIDEDKSPQHYKQGYLSGLIKALAVLGEVEYLAEHGKDREPIVLDFDEDAIEGLKAVTGAVSDKIKELELLSHSEKDIVSGCIWLMEDVHSRMLEFMDINGLEYNREVEEERPEFYYSYFEIIQKLLLSRTRHSGGTSTRAKCEQLGLNPYANVVIREREVIE